jgi:CheY-like chemotaxis protein
LRGETTKLDPQQREFMGSILSSGEILLGLLNNILDFSKIEADSIELEQKPFDVRRVTEDAARMFAPAAAAKNVGLSCIVEADVPAVLVGDVTRISQVLANLVSNAVKFTASGEIVVRVSARTVRALETATGRDGWEVTFAVRDTGIGITPEQMGRLFRSFSQADSSITRRYGGSGLGLAISRRLCRLMGGSLEAASEAGNGATFTAKMVLKPAPAQPTKEVPSLEANPTSAPAMARLRVLVAEDNPVNRRLLGVMLERLGHAVEFAHDGRQAVERVRATDYDVVLMDLQMPEMDGITATREIRAVGGAKRLPIVAVTADATTEDRELCLSAGMDDYLVKPINPELFREVLARVAAGK